MTNRISDLHSSFGHGPWVNFDGLLVANQQRGTLYLMNENGILLSVAARTSALAKQSPDWFWRGGGPIPPSSQIETEYSLNLVAYYSAAAKSRFYPISPNPVRPLMRVWGELNARADRDSYFRYDPRRGGDNIFRSYLGVHLDAGPSGTSGCEGIPDVSDWKAVQNILDGWHTDGHDTVPHYVTYRNPATGEEY